MVLRALNGLTPNANVVHRILNHIWYFSAPTVQTAIIFLPPGHTVSVKIPYYFRLFRPLCLTVGHVCATVHENDAPKVIKCPGCPRLQYVKIFNLSLTCWWGANSVTDRVSVDCALYYLPIYFSTSHYLHAQSQAVKRPQQSRLFSQCSKSGRLHFRPNTPQLTQPPACCLASGSRSSAARFGYFMFRNTAEAKCKNPRAARHG